MEKDKRSTVQVLEASENDTLRIRTAGGEIINYVKDSLSLNQERGICLVTVTLICKPIHPQKDATEALKGYND